MANDAQLNIVLQLIDNATAGVKKAADNINSAFSTASENLHSLGIAINSVGRELTRIGSVLTFTGGAIQALFVKALSDASKESLNVNQALKTLGSEFQRFEQIIANAVVPIINEQIRVFDNLNKYLMSLPQGLRESIIQGIYLTAIFVTLGGVTAIVAGKLFELVGNLLKLTSVIFTMNPVLLATIAAITTVVFLMFKFSDVTKEVLNVLQAFFLALKQGFLDIKVSLENFVSSGLMNLSKLYDALAKLPGPLQDFYRMASVEAQNAANVLRGFANKDLKAAQDAATQLQNIMMNKDGSWAQGFQGVKDKAMELINAIKGIGSAAQTTAITAHVSFNTMIQGTQTALSALSSSLQGAAAANSSFATAAQAVAIALAIVNTAQGVTRALADYPWPFNMVVGGIIAAAGAIQIATIAAQKFHSGGMIGELQSDEVPIIAQTGEGILSRRGMAALGGASQLDALNNGNSQNSGGGIEVNVYYPKMSTADEVKKLSNQLGLEIQRQLRYAL